MTHRIAAAILCACLPLLSPIAASAQSPAKEVLAADSPRATPGGVTFTASSGWSIATRANMVVLETPEGDSHLAIVDVQAKDANAAVAAAWADYRPDAKWPLKLAYPQAPRNGWEERHTFQYETSPNERATVYAIASRAGTAWAVIIVDATDGTFEKRLSQFGLTNQSLRPKGYTRETFAGKKAHPLDAARIAILKAFVEDGMKQLGVPGVGLAFIDGGKVVWEGGLGVKELGKPAKVDADTLFIAASNTKAMTTLLLAELVDEKKLRWDEPVTEAYPAFKLGDAGVTKQLQIRHLVCACTGLPRQDFEWIFKYKNATPQTSFKLLSAAMPTSGFGEVYQYNNLMASAAGYIAAAQIYPKLALGAAYDKAMQQRIFTPLGMDSTTFDMGEALLANHASPHVMDIDSHLVVAAVPDNDRVVPFRPAGGAWTSAHFLIRYVQLEANNGKLPDGSQLVSAANLLKRRERGVASGQDAHYGMGLETLDRWGITVVRHGGSLFGFKSDLYLLPDEGIGAVLLTNADQGRPLLDAFLRRLVEVLYDGQPLAADAVRIEAANLAAERARDRTLITAPANPALAAMLARRYRNAELGELTVLRKGRDTVFDFGDWQAVVASRRNADGSISFITTRPGLDGLEFVVADGKDSHGKRALLIRDGQHEYRYTEHG